MDLSIQPLLESGDIVRQDQLIGCLVCYNSDVSAQCDANTLDDRSVLSRSHSLDRERIARELLC